MKIWDKPNKKEFKEMRRRRERMRQWREEDEARRQEKLRKGPFVGRSEVMPTFDES